MKKWAKKNLVEVMLKGQALMMKKAAYVLCEYKNRVPADCGPELYTVIIVQCVATRAHAGTVCGMLSFLVDYVETCIALQHLGDAYSLGSLVVFK